MNQIDLLTESCEIERIVERHIAAADHSSHLVAVKIAITDRAVGDAAAGQLLLARHAELGVFRAARNHKGLRGIALFTADHGLGAVLVDADLRYFIRHKGSSQFLCVLAELLPQFKATDARKSRIVVHFQGIDNLTAADHLLFDDNQIQLCSLSVDRRRKTCRSGADDNHVINTIHTASLS